MLRISEISPSATTVRLRLEGRLVGPWVLEASHLCEDVLGRSRSLQLDLSELAFLDRTGVDLLLRLQARGVTLLNSTSFVEAQLRTVLGD